MIVGAAPMIWYTPTAGNPVTLSTLGVDVLVATVKPAVTRTLRTAVATWAGVAFGVSRISVGTVGVVLNVKFAPLILIWSPSTRLAALGRLRTKPKSNSKILVDAAKLPEADAVNVKV